MYTKLNNYKHHIFIISQSPGSGVWERFKVLARAEISCGDSHRKGLPLSLLVAEEFITVSEGFTVVCLFKAGEKAPSSCKSSSKQHHHGNNMPFPCSMG